MTAASSIAGGNQAKLRITAESFFFEIHDAWNNVDGSGFYFLGGRNKNTQNSENKFAILHAVFSVFLNLVFEDMVPRLQQYCKKNFA